MTDDLARPLNWRVTEIMQAHIQFGPSGYRANWREAADEIIALLSHPPQERTEQCREEIAKGIDSRVKWLMHEAHNGGNWDHLKARADEAAYLAQWIRERKT